MARRTTVVVVTFGILLAAASQAMARQSAPKPTDNYDELFQRYLAEARVTGPGRTENAVGWMAGLALDPRARQVNDLVTIRVVESITGTGSADSALDKNSAAHLGLPNFFGLENHLPDSMDPANLVNGSYDSKFKGGGSTSRSGELMATMTARVVEVLPNGDLVLQGVREIDINGDRQIVVLTGVVRPIDLDKSNSVRSTEIGQLRIRYFGQGLIKDNLKPGFLVRLLNKIF
jgi:flagellar L-ring protein precursor FlgH